MAVVIYKQSRITSIVSIILILVVVFGGIFVLKPFSSDVATLRDTVQAKETELGSVQKEYDDLEALSTEAEITEKGIQDFLNKIPTDLEQDVLIKNIYGIAEDNDIILNAISFGVSQNPLTKVNSISMSASFIGDYNDLVNFLEGLEENSREIHVKTINVQLLEEKDNIQRINFNLTLESFYQG